MLRLAKQLEQERDPKRQIEILREMLSLAQQSEQVQAEVECLRRLANAHQDLDELARAHRYRVAALEIINARSTEIHPEIRAWVEGDFGRTFFETGEWKKAEPYFERALALAQSIGAQRVVCTMNLNIFLCRLNLGERADAKARATALIREAESLDEPQLSGRIHLAVGNLVLSDGQLNECQRHARKAIAYAERAGDDRLKAAANELVGRSLQMASLVTGRKEYAAEAVDRLDGAQSEMARGSNPAREAELELERARLFELGGALPEAVEHYQRALDKHETVRRGLRYEEFQLSYFRHVQPTHEHIVELQLRMDRPDEAFSASEQLRSRLLLARIPGAQPARALYSDDEREALQGTLERYERAATSASLTGGTGGASPEGELEATRRAFLETYERARARRAPDASGSATSVVDWATAQASLGPEEALVSYVVTARTTAVFVATREGRHFQHLPYGAAQITREVDDLRDGMERLKSRVTDPYVVAQWSGRRSADEPWPGSVNAATEAVTRRLEGLYALLLAPLRPLIATKRRWTIVPYGVLHRVPWAALRGAGAYVAERHALTLLPSVSVGHALSRLPPVAGDRTVFFADPDPDDVRLGLPGSRDEVTRCAASFASAAPPFVGEHATKSAFLASAADAATIHLACHHVFDHEVPVLSFVKLAGRQASALFAHEVIDLGLKARLVTLSACGSGLSGTATGDEQLGMVRAFIAAGARSVLSTLWPIDDISPVMFFSTFYDLAGSMDASEALSGAQRHLLSHPCFSLPCFWAPYQLTGRQQPRA